MTELYEPRSKKRDRWTQARLAELDETILSIAAEQHPITLRGIFYRVVSLGASEKTEKMYSRIKVRLKKLRESGRLPYQWIADGTRYQIKPDSWSDVADLFESVTGEYRRDPWLDQPNRVYIISEKDAITGVVAPETKKWDVPLSVCRGYSSLTFVHSLAQTINTHPMCPAFVYQVGDHDPSGVDAWRSFQGRLRTFVDTTPIVCERLAVTPDQIEEYGLPTRATKKSDTRAARFAGESVEVDALPADVLRKLIRRAIARRIDADHWAASKAQQKLDRAALQELIESRIWESASA